MYDEVVVGLFELLVEETLSTELEIKDISDANIDNSEEALVALLELLLVKYLNREEVDGLKQSNEELRAKIEQIKSKQPGYWKDKGRTLLTWGALGTAGTVAVTSGLNEKEQAQLATSQGEDIQSLRNEVVKLKGAQGVRGPGTVQQGVPAIGSWRQSAPEGVGAVNQAVASSRDDDGSSGV